MGKSKGQEEHMADQLQLNSTSIDIIASASKGIVGAVPVAGALLAEIVGNIIPNQRVDRIVRFVRLLDERLVGIEQEVAKARLTQPAGIDLLEDAFTQAARATTQDRLEQIASVVANGIAPAELDHAETKRMLWLLGQLSDIEVVLLRGRLVQTREDVDADKEWRAKHEEVLRPRSPHLGSPREEIEEAMLHASYIQHVVDLGLLRHRFKTVRKGEIPEFDEKTGMMKASGSDVTMLGRMLLRYLNLIPAWCRH
jgi:hypothetical protein